MVMCEELKCRSRPYCRDCKGIKNFAEHIDN